LARALIVGCGCRGRALGSGLLEAGWQVRGTTREPARVDAIEAVGIDAAVADPDRIGSIVDQLEGVTLIYWLLGAASGPAPTVAALHTERLERLLEEIVDTPVRGFVYELATGLEAQDSLRALELLRSAGERWRIPFEVVDAPPDDHRSWLAGMRAAAAELVA
jgi:nucleoside-diphosphate-sugar epimerase